MVFPSFDCNYYCDCKHGPYYPLPETTFSINSALLRGPSESFNLQKLELSRILLSDSMVRDIIQNCPNLTNLKLSFFRGVKTLTIYKPVKLAHLTVLIPNWDIYLESLIVDALTLERFSLESYEISTPFAMIDMTSCSNLRELELIGSFITDTSFNLHISRFTLLEVLDITCCDQLRIIQISLHQLKHLKIASCKSLEVIVIDAPTLSNFLYWPWYGKLAELVLPNWSHGSMYLSYSTTSARVNSFWFLKIKEYLTVPFKRISFSFRGQDFDPEELCFDHNDLREARIPPLVEVDCLDLSDLRVRHSFDWETFLDGLLWSCHPKMVRVKVTMELRFEENWIRIEV